MDPPPFHAGPERILLQWHVTERCNLRCTHCYQEDSESGDEPTTAELHATLERMRDFIAWCRTRAAADGAAKGRPFQAHLTLTGGEPFVRRDFVPLLERVAADPAFDSFAVLTNGTQVDRPLAALLAALSPAFVQVSLDGGAATHDRLRGPGNHARVLDAIRCLVRERVPTYLSFTAHRDNFREFPEVVALGRRLGVARVWADRAIPCGQGRALADRGLSPAEHREFIELLGTARVRGGRAGPVAVHRALQFLGDHRPGARPYRCTAGDTLLAVTPDGTVLPCRRMPIPLGNLHRTPLASLWRDHPTARALRARGQTSRGCEQCFYSITCGGGLRCLSYATTGDPFRADPGCWLALREEPQECSP